jgi:uncharacterized membrane protein YphA (DoxX/SURF4 family)
VSAGESKMVWVGRVISGLLSLLFTMSGLMKLKGGAEVISGMAHLGLPGSLIVPLGILELSCVVIYLIPATSVVGAILLTGYIGGAICAHVQSAIRSSSKSRWESVCGLVCTSAWIGSRPSFQ